MVKRHYHVIITNAAGQSYANLAADYARLRHHDRDVEDVRHARTGV